MPLKFYQRPLNFIILSTLLVAVLYIIGVTITPITFNTRSYIKEAEYITGVLCWFFATLAIVIAARPYFVERFFGPMDENYRLHKYLGIAAAIVTVIHIYSKDLSYITFIPFIDFSNAVATVSPPKTQSSFINFRDVAKDVGTYGSFIALALILIAFINKISYRKFVTWHRLFALLYIILGIHVYELTTYAQFITPVGIFMTITTIIGFIYSILILCNKKGVKKTYKAKVLDCKVINNILFLKLKLDRKIFVKSGQFCFIRTPKSSYHPFSVSEYSEDTVSFIIKDCGEFSHYLIENNETLDDFYLEGPYGSFILEDLDNNKNNLFIANGVGLAVFYSTLNKLLTNCDLDSNLDVLIITRDKSKDPIITLLEEKFSSKNDNINITIYETKDHGRPTKDFYLPFLKKNSNIYFCGSQKLGEGIKEILDKDNIPYNRFYQEYVSWRALF